MRLESPYYLLLIFVVLIIVFLWWLLDKSRREQILKYFSKENRESLGLVDDLRKKYLWASRILLVGALTCFILALARPQFGQRQKSFLSQERSMVFLVDVSRSMMARDVSPSRMEVTKEEIYKILENMAQVRVGLVAFAGSVDVISPMTSDHDAIKSYVESLSSDSIVSQGTDTLKALREAKGMFERSLGGENKKDQTKVIVLFSDGEDHEKESADFAKSLSKEGFQVFTVGVGSENGGFVPEGEGSGTYLKDKTGQSVLSKPNFSFLKEVARVSGGAFFYMNPLQPIYKKLEKSIEKVEGAVAAEKKFIVRNEVYQVFILLGLLLLLLAFVFKRGRFKR